jgi:hypothetical protein
VIGLLVVAASTFCVSARTAHADPSACLPIVVPIQRTYPLDEVQAAFTELEAGHMAGKIFLIP